MKTWTMTATAALVLATLSGITQPARADAPAMKRTELSRHELAIKDREVVIMRGEFPAGAVTPRHTHPGDEVAVVLEGALTIELDGKPGLTIKAGETFFVPAGARHQGRNAGKTPVVVISTYIVEKGKPLVQLVK